MWFERIVQDRPAHLWNVCGRCEAEENNKRVKKYAQKERKTLQGIKIVELMLE